MSKRFDKRIHFIRQCVLEKLGTPALANEWYIANNGAGRPTDFLITEFRAWLTNWGSDHADADQNR